MDVSSEAEKQAEESLSRRKLAHDMRSALSVVSMSIHLLRELRQNPSEFEEICQMIESKGIEPLTDMIDLIAKLQCD